MTASRTRLCVVAGLAAGGLALTGLVGGFTAEAASTAGDPVIYYTTAVNGHPGGGIDRYDMVTKDVTTVLPEQPGVDYRTPVLSPDGRRLLVSRHVEGSASGLEPFVVNVDGTDPHRLAPIMFTRDLSASWSPDGDTVAFSGAWSGPSHLFTAPSTGGTPTDLGLGAHPSYSPDGGQLTFTRRDTQDGTDYVTVTGTGGSDPSAIAAGTEPTWSPSGDLIAYTQAGAVRVVNPEGGASTVLTEGRRPVWSPDGSMIAFNAESWPYPPTTSQCGPVSPPEFAECLGVVGSDGGNAHVLLGSRHYYIYGDTARDDATLTASWTPDAANLAFAALSGEDPAPAVVQRVPISGGLATTLAPGIEPTVGVAPVIVATALTVHVRWTTVTWDHTDALTGTLTSSSKAGLPGRTVELFQRRHEGGTWASVGTTKTGPAGDFTFGQRPHWNVDFQVRFAAPFHVSSKSLVVTVHVRPQVYLNLVPANGTVREGGHARVYGTVQPNLAGQPINLQRHTRDGWRTIQRHTTTGKSLLFNFHLPTSTVDTRTYRIVTPATAHRVRYASPRLVLTVTAD